MLSTRCWEGQCCLQGVGRDSAVYKVLGGTVLSIGVGRDSAVYKVLGGTVLSIGVGRDSAVYKVLGGTVLSTRCWEGQSCL